MVPTLQSFSASSAAGVVFVDTPEHEDRGIEISTSVVQN